MPHARSPQMQSLPPVAATFPIRSITCCAFRSSFAARLMSVRHRSTTPCRLPALMAIAELARASTSAEAAAAYQGEQMTFGPDYLIPKPFDPRLIRRHCRRRCQRRYGNRRGDAPVG